MPFQNEREERQNKCLKAKLDNSDGTSVITESSMNINNI